MKNSTLFENIPTDADGSRLREAGLGPLCCEPAYVVLAHDELVVQHQKPGSQGWGGGVSVNEKNDETSIENEINQRIFFSLFVRRAGKEI